LTDVTHCSFPASKYLGYPSPKDLQLGPAPRETEVELLIDTRGPEQVQALLQAIAEKGYSAQSFIFE
jgi:hypothetical protein